VRQSLRYGGHYLVGFFAGAAFLLIGLRSVKMPIGRGLDLVAPGLALGHGIGRIGCYFAGCCWGAACDAPWGIVFTSERAHRLTGVPLNVALHPTQLYEAGIELGIGALLLLRILRAPTNPPTRPGSTFLAYIALYGFARFGLEFLREDPRGLALGMPTSQPVALATAIGATAILAFWTLTARRPPASAAKRRGKK
jgi:phosphatidylglycerol:prolipoprotein diacylglycerol transferase